MLKDYIVISNKADEVNRLSLEKLGFSTKRNDSKTIGQFGSGVKYAPIAALRSNLEWFFTGNDKNGPYKLEYVVQEEDGIKCVAYKYGDIIKPSSFTLDAGVMSWEDPFQILREPIANAMDSATMYDDGWYNIFVITVDTDNPESMKKLEPKDGVFSVYVSASPELMDIVRNYDKYFSVNREVCYQNHYGKLLDKIDATSRFYTLNVLVKTDESLTSIYDYQFDNLELNEERTVKSLWDLDYSVAKTMCSVEDQDTAEEYISEFVKAGADGTNIWELVRLSSQNFKWYGNDKSHEAWNNAWTKLFSSKAVMLSAEQGISDGLRMGVINRGYKPIVVANRTAYNLFLSMEFKTVFDILGEQIDYEIEDNISDYPHLVEAIKVASYFENGLVPLQDTIGVFESKKEGVLGMCVSINESEKRIIIDKSHARHGTIAELVGTLIHEFDHYNTNVGDSSDMMGREFRDIADKRIGKMMTELFKDTIIEKVDGGIFIHLDKAHYLSGFKYSSEWSNILNATILKLGNFTFFIETEDGPDSIESSDRLSVSDDGRGFFIPVVGRFRIRKEYVSC